MLALPALALPAQAAAGFTARRLGRITIDTVSVYSEPSDKSTILYQRKRDEVINLYDELISPDGPGYNPRWYKVWRGYIHCARVQAVAEVYNQPATSLPEGGQLGEITVPVSYPMYKRPKGWQTLYPLYYESVFWITDITEGPEGTPWYQITEAWSKDKFYLPARDVRLIPSSELAPISPDVPPEEKRVEVSILHQQLRAFEGDDMVFECRISSGLDKEREGYIPWRTPHGSFRVLSKMPSQRMGEDPITADISGYVLPGVPWVVFFHETGVATHGTYWHDNYGVPMSHGCINMRPADAKWLYLWTTPVVKEGARDAKGNGTRIKVATEFS